MPPFLAQPGAPGALVSYVTCCAASDVLCRFFRGSDLLTRMAVQAARGSHKTASSTLLGTAKFSVVSRCLASVFISEAAQHAPPCSFFCAVHTASDTRMTGALWSCGRDAGQVLY